MHAFPTAALAPHRATRIPVRQWPEDRRRNRWLLLALTAALAGGVAARLSPALFGAATPAPPAPAPARTAAPQAVGAAPQACRGAGAVPYGAAVGTRMGFDLRFDLRLDREILSVAPGTARRTRPFGLRARGRLDVTVREHQGDAILVHYAAEALDLRAEGDGPIDADAWAARIARGMARGFDVSIDETGRFLGFGFDEGASPELRRFAQSLHAAFRFEVESARPFWATTDADGLGEYRFRYAHGALHGTPTVERQRIACRPFGVDDSGNARAVGEAHAIFAPELGWLRFASVDERIAWDLAASGETLTLRLEGAMVLESVEPPAPASAAQDPAARAGVRRQQVAPARIEPLAFAATRRAAATATDPRH